MSFCPQCGAKLEEGAAFCAQCGTAINNSSAGADAAFDAGEDGFTPVREEPNPQPQQEETNMTRRWQQQHQQERQRNAGAAGSQQNQAQRPPRQPNRLRTKNPAGKNNPEKPEAAPQFLRAMGRLS